MLDIIASALVNLLAGWHLFYMMIGVLVGLVIGILPGLGSIAGMSILLPIIYGMEPVSAPMRPPLTPNVQRGLSPAAAALSLMIFSRSAIARPRNELRPP